MTEPQPVHVLCIEDNQGVARLIQKHLKRQGYAVDLAFGGQEGLALIDANPYDVVLVDHLMPDCTGLEVIQAISERDRPPGIIMVTGAGDERTAVEAMKLGADDYLVKDVDGGYLGLLSTVIERVLDKRQLIEQRQQALDLLRKSERQYRMLVETTGDIILLHNEEGRITFVNQAGLAFAGFTEEQVLGRPLADFLPLAEQDSLSDRRRRRLSGDRAPYLYQTAFTNRAGERVEVSVQSTPIFDGGAYAGSLIAARDVTDLERMKEQLQQQEQLVALGQLASGIAHSFRNLLNTIILYAELDMRRSDLPAAVIDNLRIIRQESRRASDLVQQILDFSSRAMIRRKPVDLADLLRDLISDLRATMPDGIEVSLVCETHAPGALTASVDPARLRQALTNLAVNARDAMPRGGELRFALSTVALPPHGRGLASSGHHVATSRPLSPTEGEDWIRLDVSDTGTGMTEEVRSHLFSPFFTTKRLDQGTGLGLAQVYGIVRQHDGAIDVETEPGVGTTFTIYLPAHEEQHRAEGAQPSTVPSQISTKATADRRRGTILLVSDAEQSRQVGERMLASLNYRVVTARSAREALALCQSPRWVTGRSDRIALLLMDLDSQTIASDTLVDDVKRARPEMKVLAMTADDVDEADAVLLRETGFASVIHRPFEPDEVATALRRALDQA